MATLVKTGIADAIAERLRDLHGNNEAVAEAIENNVRSKIVKEHLADPAYYEKMSTLLDEVIHARKARAIEYEEYLQRVAEIARNVEIGMADDTPKRLTARPELRALYNNLKDADCTMLWADRVGESDDEDPALALAVTIDAAVRRVRPDGWRGVQAREQVIKAALYEILRDEVEVERLFPIVKARSEY